ncbi:hypothetical protein [Coleofasciculus sp. FACHB-SPT36]|uniref:hypothetical protein n=1 Tax=Cyanophyceae TaxID=3028117 RepID=UPI00168BC8AF|nr:hypothetical protein [Coleofasciculus sp. FACHB-SPT36]
MGSPENAIATYASRKVSEASLSAVETAAKNTEKSYLDTVSADRTVENGSFESAKNGQKATVVSEVSEFRYWASVLSQQS